MYKKVLQALSAYFLHPIYLLQLENYNLERFWRGSLRHIVKRPLAWRQQIVWTTKLKLVTGMSIGLLLLATLTAGTIHLLLIPIGFVIFSILFFLFLIVTVWFIGPFEAIVIDRILDKATSKIGKRSNLVVIGIAGSYGKTTMKEVMTAVLKEQYQVLATPENINTPIGIARLILNELKDTTQILIVEIGEFLPGDVQDICEMVRPNIGILTGINEAHMERMKTLDATVSTIFELAQYSQENSLIILNADDENIVNNYEKYAQNHQVAFYSSTSAPMTKHIVQDYEFRTDGSGQAFTIGSVAGGIIMNSPFAHSESVKDAVRISTKLLGEYIIGTAMAAIIIGKELGILPEKITHAFSGLPPVPHRLEPIKNANSVLIIDDSYNGNPEGVKAAIKVLGKFTDRRKIFLTPGLVELGSSSIAVHEELGKLLSKVADVVLLVRTSSTVALMDGLRAGGFPANTITVFPTAQKAHASLKDLLKPGDVILFQNDWPDNYL